MSMEGELWHIVEAKRDDGTPTMFRIRELEPRRQLDKIFVVEMPYPAADTSGLPNASAYRRLADFDEQWLRPACVSLGWELVGSKTEDGSFFLYMYGASDPNELVAKLSPFDAGLGFYDDSDPDWLEYGTLRELLDQAKAIPQADEPAERPEVTMPIARPAKQATPKKTVVAAKPAKKPPTKPPAKAAPKAAAKTGAKSARATKPAKKTANKSPTTVAKRAKPAGKPAKTKPARKRR